MSTLQDIVRTEAPREVILLLIRRGASISYPQLDRLYVDYYNETFNNLNLLEVVASMRAEGLVGADRTSITKGPQWRSPNFSLASQTLD